MEINQTNKLVLKPVSELFEYRFFIPSYQRGYRWTDTQVTQLLDDIWEFAKNPPRKEEGKEEPFYCLQPIVVKMNKMNNEWEVIDGQQRLTTITLIIHYFNEMWIGKQKIQEPQLRYETRDKSYDFIRKLEIDIEKQPVIDIETTDIKKIKEEISKLVIKQNDDIKESDNIDFSHIARAYKTIHYWVLRQKSFSNNRFQDIFQYLTKVIWYETEETETNNSIDIFTRLNIGKIPLTNAELIKALFLQKGNFAEEKASLKQIQIASEWDTIEKTLQDDPFWLFIYNPDNPLKYDNRIEYIFDLMKERTEESEYYHTFNEFYKDFSEKNDLNKPDIDKIWLNIKKYFLTFEEWFKDYELFHYVGYLIDCGVSIDTIKKKSSGIEKNKFKKDYLIKEIKKQVNCKIDDIEYGDKHVKKVLILFNIQTVLETQKSDMRFPFHKYKIEKWDIEHVCSQTDKMVNGNQRSAWINDILDYFTDESDVSVEINSKNESILEEENSEKKEIIDSLKKLKKFEKIDSDEFEIIFKKVQKYFKEENQTDDKDNISNLVLLDYATNRSYGNAFFPIKRKRIIENDSKGIFVPIATKNLFLKYYSKKFDNIMYWDKYDARYYLNAIKTTLKEFLPKID